MTKESKTFDFFSRLYLFIGVSPFLSSSGHNKAHSDRHFPFSIDFSHFYRFFAMCFNFDKENQFSLILIEEEHFFLAILAFSQLAIINYLGCKISAIRCMLLLLLLLFLLWSLLLLML